MLTKTTATALLQDIRDKIESGDTNLHCVLAMNWFLRQPNLKKVMDKSVETQAREIWGELTAAGLELEKPPILFGLPDDF